MLDARHLTIVAGAAACLPAAIAAGQLDFDTQALLTVDAPDYGIGRGVCQDLDGFNGPDLVIPTNGDINELLILLNDGAGGFGALDGLSSGAMAAACAGDWDGDGLTDVLSVDVDLDRVRLARQVAPGDWEFVDSAPLSGAPTSIVCCDLDLDGLVDVVVGIADGVDVIEVFLNDGSGGLGTITPVSYPMGPVTALVCCDYDADGDADIVSVGQLDETVRARRNDGAGGFLSPQTYATGTRPSDIICCDISGDGRPDLAVPNSDDGTITMLRNIGGGAFAFLPPAVPAGPNPVSVTCGDFDCDGDVDLVVANNPFGADPYLSGLLNDGTGNGWTLVESFWSTFIPAIVHVFACEFDGAAGTDLITFEAQPFPSVRQHFNINPDCATCVEPPPGAVAWYPGDICLPDDLLENHDGIYSGLPFCPFHWLVGGGSLGFDPGPTFVTVPGDCELAPDDHDFTLNGWVRTAAPGMQAIASMGGAPGYVLDIFNGHLRLVVCDTGGCSVLVGTSTLTGGDWHHVAFTVETGASTTLRLWVDGHLEGQLVTALGAIDPSDPLLLGAAPSPTPSYYLDGELDEVQVHPRALSAAEIQSIYLAGIAGQCKDLCTPSGPCVEETTIEVSLAGAPDGFALPGEPAVPGPVLAGSCAGSVDFDVVPAGASVCHTFTGLPTNVVGGTLELRLRAAAAASTCDDTISLQATGGAPAFLWSRRLGAPGAGACAGDEGLLPCPWDPMRTRTFCLDLDQLPEVGGSTSSLIDGMATSGRLDVRVDDDTGVDFMRLRVVRCPCPSDVSGDGSVDGTDLVAVILAWGACPDPCPPCPADVNGDCVVDGTDLVAIILAWGPC